MTELGKKVINFIFFSEACTKRRFDFMAPTDFFLNLPKSLSPKSDQHQISSCDINTKSREKVMRIYK